MIFCESLLWGAFPVVSLFAYRFLSPIRVVAYSTLLGCLFFGFFFLWRKGWKELKNREAWKNILLAALFIGVCYYTVFFIGLRFTTAGNAALLSSMELWFSFIFFGLVLHKEKYTSSALIGAGLMFLGMLLVIFRGSFDLNWGDLIILLATMFPPIGNFFQQKARKMVSATTLLFIRSAITFPILFLISFLFEKNSPTNLLPALPALLINGLLLFGFSKILWVEGIHRISVAKAASINTLMPVATLIYAFFVLEEIPSFYQLGGLIPILLGGILITRKNFLQTSPPLD